VGPVEVDPLAIAVAVLIGMGAALIAAGVPAWGAARLPTLVALSGRRPPATPARRLLSMGLVLVAIALSCTIMAPIVGRLSESDMPLLLLLVGAVTGVLGFGACSPWLLERLEGPARRLPLAVRIAVRDTSRARTRNGPIVTAVLASVAGMIALSALLASQTAMSAERWRPPVPPDVLIVGGAAAATAGPGIAGALDAVGSGPMTGIAAPGGPDTATMALPLAAPNTRDEIYDTSIDSFVIGDESMLRALGGASAVAAFREGTVVGFPWQEVRPVTRATLALMDESYEEVVASFEVPITMVMGGEERSGLPDGIIPVATARSLGLVADPEPDRYLVRLGRTVTQQDVDLAARLAASDSSTWVTAALRPSDAMAGFRLLMLAASLVVALSVTGVAVALGETEARADQRTLLSLGADRGLRRRMTAARGAVLAGLAGVLAVPAGLLPVWGVLFPRGWPIVVPLPEVIGALVILPLMAVAGGLLLSRPMDEWATRRDATG
jgi:putative ABC transport system permease protein